MARGSHFAYSPDQHSRSARLPKPLCTVIVILNVLMNITDTFWLKYVTVALAAAVGGLILIQPVASRETLGAILIRVIVTIAIKDVNKVEDFGGNAGHWTLLGNVNVGL